jgi:lipopolysaccharide transport system ATP-binding protein
MSDSPLITLDRVACRYKVRHGRFRLKSYEALRDISFTIDTGETIGLIGRNGAGKSTLLSLISGIILPDSGKVIFHKPATVSLLSLQLGFSPDLTGRDNAIIGAMLLGYTKKEAALRLERIIAFAELENWIDEPLRTYSSGMRARLGFAVAMEMNPDVLLVDEILGVGDEAFRKKSTQAMKGKMESGQTVVFVSHALPVVRELCSRVVWIDNGLVRIIGEPDQVICAYQEQVQMDSQPLLGNPA